MFPGRWLEGCVVLLVLSWILAVWIWPDLLFWLCYDDSFYYFEIARNLASGYGSTFDQINPTNGYHPLWLWICTVVYWLGFDKLQAVQVLVSLQGVAFAFALVLVAAMLRTAIGTFPRRSHSAEQAVLARGCLHWGLTLTLAVLATSPSFIKIFVNGMESGVYVPLYVLLLLRAQSATGDLVANTSPFQRWQVALLGTLCFFARTDAGLMLLCLGLWCLPAAFGLRFVGLWRLAQMFLLPGLAIVGFLVTNQLLFGLPMQVSGEVKRLPLGWGPLLVIVGSLAIGGVIGLILRGEFGRKFPRVKRFVHQTGWFGIFLCLTFGYYLGFQTYPRLWYFGPAVIYGLLVFLIAFVDLLDGILEEAQAETSPTGKLKGVTIGAIAIALFTAGIQVQQAAGSGMLAMRRANRAAAEWISEHLPEDTVLGSWDAGVLGYFCRQKVINLDGFVNSADYLRVLRAQDANIRQAWLRERGLSYLVNHAQLEGSTLRQQAVFVLGDDVIEDWKLVNKWPFVFSGTTNRLSTGPKQMAVFLYRLPWATENDRPK